MPEFACALLRGVSVAPPSAIEKLLTARSHPDVQKFKPAALKLAKQ